jgi:hypothetical protein
VLAEPRCVVTVVYENVADRTGTLGHDRSVTRVPRGELRDVAHTDALMVATGEKRGTRSENIVRSCETHCTSSRLSLRETPRSQPMSQVAEKPDQREAKDAPMGAQIKDAAFMWDDPLDLERDGAGGEFIALLPRALRSFFAFLLRKDDGKDTPSRRSRQGRMRSYREASRHQHGDRQKVQIPDRSAESSHKILRGRFRHRWKWCSNQVTALHEGALFVRVHVTAPQAQLSVETLSIDA